MREIKSVVRDIQSAFDKNNYPSEFLADYDQIECLAGHYGRETFLVQKKNSEELFIAKCYDKSVFSLPADADLLSDLEHPGLPRFAACYDNDKMLCIVREYIEGTPLGEYAAKRSLSSDEIKDICVRLCDILSYLHKRPKPVIHRDIKPGNIIIRPDGNIVLIDFDIARMFRDGAGEDTVFFGTKGFAPPEQYGFAQTDARADIYSFGVLLRCLLTGNIRENRNIRLDPGLQAIIDKCTAFAPEDRFKDILELKSALLAAKGSRPKLSVKQIIRAAVLILLFFVIGFVVGRYTNLFSPPPKAISFSEPLIEAAVRLQLGVGAEANLNEEELSEVKQLFIFGKEVYKDEEAFFNRKVDESVRGGLKNLEDIRMLPNLEVLYIAHQGDLDISGLEQASNLWSLQLKNLGLSDCKILSELKDLKHACLFDTDISDFRALESCERLESLNIGLCPIRNIEQIGEYPWLRELGINNIKMESLDGLEAIPRLKIVYLEHSEIEDISALLKLDYLETVYAGEENFVQISEVLAGSDVEVVLSLH
ncbi:MAG: protein kinase [Clostridiales bacterium]|nr:protein kinase [Clostridiales bacterium]